MRPVNQIAEQMYLKFAPAPSRATYLHQRAKNRFYTYLRKQIGDFVDDVDPGPAGTEEIILRTAVLGNKEKKTKLNHDYYFRSGYSTLLLWLKQLERHHFNLRTAQAIMELGCGSARLIRHLRAIRDIRLVGTDVMPEFITWCRANVPGIEFYVNDLQPPLTFAADNSFDLVFAHSVFTHIPLDLQPLWIDELHRILTPGGFLLVTVLGRYHQERMLSPAERHQLEQEHHYTLSAHSQNASISTQLIGSWDVFQTRPAVLQAFGARLHVCDYIAGHLDLLVLQKPV